MHVPRENLDRYRALMDLYRRFNSAGNQKSNTGDHGAANRLWRIATLIREHAQTLRVPGRKEVLANETGGSGDNDKPDNAGSVDGSKGV